jgi:cysteine synthase A
MDWSNPLLSQMPEPMGEITVNDYAIPVIPIPNKLLSTGIRGENIEVYALAAFAVPPNGKRIPAEYMIDMAVKTGLVKKGGALVEPTSGGMGAAMAFCAKKYDISVYAIVTDGMPEGKVLPQTRLGAIVKRESEVVWELGLETSPGTIELSKLYAQKLGGVFLDQYHNPWNPESWATLVAPQLYDLFKGQLTEAFFGLGSTGTLRGLGSALKKHDPNIKLVATHPYFKRHIAGLRGPERLKEVAPWQDVPDYVEAIDERTAKAYSSELFSFAGIPAGESSGAVFGMCDHYYLDRAVRGELRERSIAIMPFMDTFVPYLQIA